MRVEDDDLESLMSIMEEECNDLEAEGDDEMTPDEIEGLRQFNQDIYACLAELQLFRGAYPNIRFQRCSYTEYGEVPEQ